ncbi:hypothetical protein INT45_001922 [Circinella minor]|uniref:Peptidase S59 domain-containing protein n=1 Tax=Circinella minor TaxID=1195481 RepID=A0A8H7S831_9FUNG|nr:hypothetical protein INT45_001922 [Circinella minor]
MLIILGSTPATSGFGAGANTQAAGGGGLFGQSRTSAFGQPATSTTGGVFGGAATSSAPGAFGQQTQQSAFGAGGMGGSAFGAQQGAPGGNQGTAVADFTATTDRDIATGTNNFFQTITAMPQYRSYSLEELRLQDYAQNRKNSGAAGAPAAGGFGSTATGGFGTGATGGFGQQQQPGSTPFGQSAGTSAFGQQQQPAAGGFGAGATGGGLFGQPQQQQQGTPAFGSSTTGGFGTGATSGGFGATSGTTGGFGSAGGFGATAGNAAKPLFGGSQPATGGFGAASTTPAFGAGATTGGFGQPNQQQQTGGFGGGFGAKPSGTATTGGFGQTTGGFGTGAGGFGSTATNKPASSFSFNTPGTQTSAGATTGGFGAGGFGAQQPATGGFGGAGTQQTSLFGGNKPATSAPLFGGAQSATGGFGVGTGGTAGATGGFGSSSLFNQKPATGGLTGGTGLFNNQSTTGGFGGGFGTQPQGTSSFTLPATGGLTSFGANGLQPGQQQPMIATVDNKPYGSNPLFDTTKIGATAASSTTNGTNKQGPSAVALDSSNKKPTSAHRPMAPRVVSKIKLRGFSLGPAGRTSPSKKMSSLEGLSDDAVLGPNAFSTRSANKKLVFEKDVDTADIASLLTKKDEKPPLIFDPKLEMIARKKELEREKQQASASPSSSTSLVGAGVSTSSSTSNIPAPGAPVRGESSSSSVGARFVSNSAYSATTTSQGYYSSPTLETLQSMTNEELKRVDNFMVGRRGYGEVRFDEPVDLSGLDLYDIMGTIVILEEKSVVIYPDESTKAPRGSALNVPATVKLENCYALDKESRRPIKDPENPRFRSFYDRLRNRQGVEFVDYDIETGTWSFKVEFF